MVDIGMRMAYGPIKVSIRHTPIGKVELHNFELWELRFQQGDTWISITSRYKNKFSQMITEIENAASELGVHIDE